jgi:dTMP kinase
MLRGDPADRMESAGPRFTERVRNGYLEIARSDPERFVVVNGMPPVAEVQETVWRTVMAAAYRVRMQGTRI